MSIYSLKTIAYSGDMSWILCSRWQHDAGKLQRHFQSPFNLKSSLRLPNRFQSRWPGKRNLADSVEYQLKDNYSLSNLWKPFVFTISVSSVSLAGAAIWQYENVRSQAVMSRKWSWKSDHQKNGLLRQHLHDWWKSLSVADKTFAPLCAINVLVFLSWMVPRWRPVMTKYFTASLTSSAVCWPMLLSVFSHYNTLHLAANMFVLHSFSEKAVSALGKEQFVGVYMSAGVISSFTSYLFKAITRSPTSSLGASGAVMCVLSYVCFKHPDSKLAVIFLPQFPFDAGSGIKALMCFDFLGCVLRWGFFDHAAHLGGTFFGMFWYYWGYEYIWRKRDPLISAWHKLRGPIQ